jgi:hypothetical protein
MWAKMPSRYLARGDRHSAPVHLWRWLTQKSFELALARNGFPEQFENQRVGDYIRRARLLL